MKNGFSCLCNRQKMKIIHAFRQFVVESHVVFGPRGLLLSFHKLVWDPGGSTFQRQMSPACLRCGAGHGTV